MADYDLGEIKRVGLREVWGNSERDFSKWLAEEENLSFLGEVIGVEIRLVKTEASVGDFSVDILAETGGESKPIKIVIENQLERTDHTHLGQLITYASGADAEIAVWVVKEAREEHQRAIDWLNEHTNDSLAFFLLQVELWQIDGSRPAPKFEIVSKPNEWAKAAKQSVNRIKGLSWTAYTFKGERYPVSSATGLLVDLFNNFIEYDSQFINKLKKSQPRWWNNKRNFIAETSEGLYLSDPEFLDTYVKSSAKELKCKLYINTHFNAHEIERRIELSSKVLGLEYGKDVILHKD